MHGRGLIHPGFPFASFVAGAIIPVLALRFFSKSILSYSKESAKSRLQFKLFGLPEAAILIPALSCIFIFINIFLRGPWGILHTLFFGFVGAISTIFSYAGLRFFIFESVKQYSVRLRAVVYASMLGFILLATFVGSFDQRFQDRFYSEIVIAGLPVLLGTFILGADWLRACGWRIESTQSEGGIYASESCNPFWLNAYLFANCLLGCCFLCMGIPNQCFEAVIRI